MKFINKYGLLNAEEADFVSENTFHITLQYVLLSKWREPTLQKDMRSFIKECWDGEVFHNSPHVFENSKDNFTSPDQLNAYMLWFHMFGNRLDNRETWDYLKSHWFTYDNKTKKTNFDRIMQPTTICLAWYLGSCDITRYNGSKWVKFLLRSCLSWSLRSGNSESGKLKAWVICEMLEFDDLIKDFPMEEIQAKVRPASHPINILLSEKV